jgi:hypothetical protein
MRTDANCRVILALAQSILEALGSRESIQPASRHEPVLLHEVSVLTLCPLG